MKKIRKKWIIIFVVIISFITFVYTIIQCYTPLYDERLTLDLRNNTFNTLNDIKISYGSSDTVVNVPALKPFERIIVIPKRESVSETSVLITYNGEIKEIIGKYRPKSQDCAIISFTNKYMEVKHDTYIGNIFNYMTLRPYTEVYDLDGSNWNGKSPLLELIKKIIF